MRNLQVNLFPYNVKEYINVLNYHNRFIRTILINTNQYWDSVYHYDKVTRYKRYNICLGIPVWTDLLWKEYTIDFDYYVWRVKKNKYRINYYQFIKYEKDKLLIGYLHGVRIFPLIFQGKINNNKFYIDMIVNDEELMNYINSYKLLLELKC